jgi:hypothetical protein
MHLDLVQRMRRGTLCVADLAVPVGTLRPGAANDLEKFLVSRTGAQRRAKRHMNNEPSDESRARLQPAQNGAETDEMKPSSPAPSS